MTEEAKEYAVTAKRDEISLAELADLAGVNYKTAWQINNSKTKRGETAKKLAEILASLGLDWGNITRGRYKKQAEKALKKPQAYNLTKTVEVIAAAPREVAAAEVDEFKNRFLDAAGGGQALAPLEELIGEIKRRLPHGTKVMIEI